MKFPASLSLRSFVFIFLCTMLMACRPARAVDLSQGLMRAVPAPNGPPAMDGSDNGWDLTGAEPVWMSTQLAKQLHASIALNYDDNNLYVYAKVSLPDRKLKNHNGPTDGFWNGDILEFRLCSDPSLAYPLSNANPVMHTSKQVCHITFWKDTNDGKTYINIQYGGMHGGGQGTALNPAGSQNVITESDNQYVIQAVLPWSVLNVPGGKNPFKPGSKMTAIFALHWATSTWFYAVNAVYSASPGDFAFMQWQDWGQVEFSPTGNLKPQHGTMEEALAATTTPPIGVPITIKVPEAGKLSVNIVGEKGEVIRDILGGQPVEAGDYKAYWDGRDQWGFALKPGKYHWASYFSHGLTVKLTGFVGSSGNPPYPTDDGKGGWGGDHGVPSAVAADDSGIYFGWTGCEAQAGIVKIDYAGNTLWRRSPFVPGGGGALRALASNDKYLFAVYSGFHSTLTRLDPKTGLVALFGKELDKGTMVPFGPVPAAGEVTAINAPEGSLPPEGGVNGMGRTPAPGDGTAPECVGVAATANEVFASVYSQNIIQVLDVETGALTRTLACPAPRGLALDAKGNLYAVSFGTSQAPQVVRFDGVQGTAKPVVTAGLIAPVGVTVDASGQISVTDEGTSQQIKTFSADGKLVQTFGKQGGRPWEGAYDPTSYRDPFQITADKQGGLIVSEASIPKIFDRIEIASGKTLNRWFGWPGYGVENIPDSEDPMTNYYPFEPEGFARATSPVDGTGYPDAYWVPKQAGMEEVGPMFTEDFPFVSVLANGKKYFIEDSNPHAVCLIDGDKFLPVGSLKVNNPGRPVPGVKTPELVTVSVWIDKDGDHKSQPGEISTLTTVGGNPLPHLNDRSLSMWLDEKGNAYILTYANSVLKIPSEGFAKNGAILWNPDKAYYVLPTVIPSLLSHGIGGRQGMPGLRTDSKGNIYTCLSANVPALTPDLAQKIQAMFPDVPQSNWLAYATPEQAKAMKEGLGHTAESNIAKFAKFSPDGKLIWIAGRKATAQPGPGEMYHFWDIGGTVGDDYVAGCSEWGTIYFYTSDGFYVDTIMNDPNNLAPGGPYTFGSENFSGQIRSFPNLGKVFAFDQGGIYTVGGFDRNLKVSGEQRLHGTVDLDKTYEGVSLAQVAQNLQFTPVSGDVTKDATWSSAPVATLMRAGAPLATAQVGYDNDNIYAKIHVVDDTPLQNGGNDPNVVFKTGDVVGLDLGPAGTRNKPMLGDLRILAAKMQGQSRLIAMKPVSRQPKQPQQYMTQASGTKPFDFVGDIPGGRVVLTPDADNKGYTTLMTVPRSFVEFPIAPGTAIKGDVEVLLSGVKSQGVQATSRNWLYSGGHVETTMIDDIPTEAWLYPQYWGDVLVK